MGDKGVFEQVVTSAIDWPAVEADIAARQVGGGASHDLHNRLCV